MKYPEAAKPICIGIDIGGTSIKGVRVRSGVIQDSAVKAIDAQASEQQILSDLYDVIEALMTSEVGGIGVGVPSMVNDSTGEVYDVQNIPSWKKVSLKNVLENRYSITVQVNNDANCFALGEKYFGKGKRFKHFLGLTLGTGLGMGIIANDMLYTGLLCGAGEIGMIPYKNGIMEHYSSGLFFQKAYHMDGERLMKMASGGDKTALKAFDEFGQNLGVAIHILLHIMAPEAIILGGSIRNAWPYFKSSLYRQVNLFRYKEQLKGFKLEISENKNIAQLGAAALCMEGIKPYGT